MSEQAIKNQEEAAEINRRFMRDEITADEAVALLKPIADSVNTTYIITGEYYNGDKYADKAYGINDLIDELVDIRNDELSTTIGDSAKVRTDKLTISIED